MSGPTLVRVVDGPDAGMVHAVTRRVHLGRGADVDLVLTDPAVSRRHAILEPDPGGLLVVDTGSATGTRVDGRRCAPSRVAAPGSVVRLGESTLVVLRVAPAPRAARGHHQLDVSGPGTRPGVVDVEGEVLVGRDDDCTVRVDHASVSRRHAAFRPVGDELVLTDLGSANGTRVNEHRVRGQRTVGSGDVVTLGSAGAQLGVVGPRRHTGPARELRLRAEGADATTAVTVVARPSATVQHVVDELAAHLGLPVGSGTVWLAYLAAPGRLLRPGDRWQDLPLARGEVVTVAAFDRTPDEAASGVAERVVRGAGGGADPAWTVPVDTTVNTPPRASGPPAPVVVKLPRVPEGTTLRGRGVAWQVAGGGIAVLAAAVVALQFRSAALFAVVGAVAGLATVAFGLLGDQSRRRHGVREFREGVARVESALSAAAAAQSATLRDLAPDLASLRSRVRERSARLWERRVDDPDALRLALGTGGRALVRTLSDQGDEHGPYAAQLHEVLDRWRVLEDVPVTTPSGGVVGIAGPRRLTTEVAAHAVVEAAVLHAPSTLEVVVVGGGTDWAWVRWLPHVEPRTRAAVLAASSREEVHAALAGGGREGSRRLLLVLAHGHHGQVDASVLLRAVDPDTGLVLVLDDDVRALPPECGVVVEVAADGTARAEGAWHDGPVGPFRVRRVAPDAAEDLAIELGRLSDPRAADRAVRESQGVIELSGVAGVDGPDVSARWDDGADALDAVFAVDDGGQPVTLDLRRDGPHGVIAGTTGAGKSELLLSVLGSLVARHPPERLVLFLIDFKGGATFAPLRDLPHVVGYVTDLDGSERLSERAFTALEAEIVRRKRVLAAAGVPDLTGYERLAGRESLPSLLVVIDEFALLVTEQPSVKARLDAVAAQGRSLGIHLLLATQSPGGVVTPAIRANTNVWLCLRVANEGESLELLGSRQAAHIPTDRPGRAYLRRGAENALTAFQTARITVPSESAEDHAVSVTAFAVPGRVGRAGGERAGTAGGAGAAQSAGPTQLDQLVHAAGAEHARRGDRRPTALWVPPLPAHVDPAELAELAAVGAEDGGHGDRRLDVVVGLLDEPHEQRQRPWVVDVAASNLIVAGVFRSGRTTAVRQVVHGLVAARTAARLHLYVVDARGDLADLADLPHTGGHVGVHDRELLVAVVDRVGALIDRRRETGYDPARDPRVVMVVDDYASFREACQGLMQDRLTDRFATIAASGPSLGVHLLVTCNQVGDLRMTLAAHFLTRLLLRQPDPSDYIAIDVRLTSAELPPDLPGRGLVKGGSEVQVAWAQGRPAGPWGDGIGGPRPLLRLPADHAEPVGQDRSSWPDGHVPIGVGRDDWSTVWLGPRHGPHLLVLGESLSGRTTALRTVVERLLAEDPARGLAVVSQRRTPAWPWADHPQLLGAATTSAEVEALLDLVEGSTQPVVLAVDDAEGLSLPVGTGDRLDRVLRTARDRGLRSVVAGRAADWPRLFDGWARYLTSLRTMLLLAPTVESAVGLDLRLPPTVVPMVPGRGFLVSGAQAELLQVTRLDSTRGPAEGGDPPGAVPTGQERPGAAS